MKKLLLPAAFLSIMLFGCGAAQHDNGAESAAQPQAGGSANDFNPYMRKSLPNTRTVSPEGAKMLTQLGAKAQTIEGEARHRKQWREEIYPVVFGNKNAPGEIIVLLDFSDPQSEKDWQAVVSASKSLQPQNCKIVVLAKSQENYGIDLMGMAIWLAHSRPGQAMPWLTYALRRWNEVKTAQKAQGNVKKFNNEYDSAASAHDFPIHYGYLAKIRPPIPASQELAVARYCYDAGNVNMYQATQVASYYGVGKLPAVIVNGKPIRNVTADNILAALR